LTALAVAFLVLLGVSLLREPSHALFSVHMAQHLLLIVVAAPFLVLGGVRLRTGAVGSWGAFVVVFLFWHWPAAFRWAAENRAGEFLELASILLAATCFWSAMLDKDRLNPGARALMVMTAAFLTDLPGVVMLFAPRVICTMPHEKEGLWGLSPLQDQQVAGLLMWVPANLVFFGVATFLFFRWLSDSRLVTS
jgi:cytochrome c oxidase assembly factor CtaG